MLWIIYTTGKCNLRCSYCGGSIPESQMPYTPNYDIEELRSIIEKDPNPTIIFYGGEPLLNSKFIMDVMDTINARFGIQTNGTLRHLLPDNYWKRMSTVLLSIDGVEWLTDMHRGKGVYRKVVETAKWLSENCRCRIIARMTVTKESCIYRDVIHLLNLGYFTHVHWQLNVIWSEEWNFIEWSKKRYLPGIRNLVAFMREELVKGQIPGIIPFLGILTAEKIGGWRHVPCGAGLRSFTITTNGKILACPIAISEEWAVLGDLEKGIVKRMRIEDVSPTCLDCNYFKWCGGRCLYALKERYWGESGFKQVCWVTQKTIDHVLRLIPLIDRLNREDVIRWEDILYDPLEDSTEIIP